MDSNFEAVNKLRQPIEPETVSPSLFAHFVVRSSNLPAMREWYRTVLAARVVFENDYICFLTYDDEHHRVAIVNVPGLHAVDAESWGLAHLAYGYKTLRQLLSTYRRLKGEGILPYRPINHGPTTSLYYRDPDGNNIELQVDNFATKEEAARYFLSEAFRKNPIGVAFDPEELVKAYEAGVPESELVRRPAATAKA
jgi:catechol-2,3-dioxygenase